MPKINCPNDVFYVPIIMFGHQTKYVVSTDGDIYNITTGRKLVPEITNRGYQRVLIYYKGKRKHCAVHRLVADAFLPNPRNLPEVNHKNGNKLKNSVYNLEWCTAEYNVRHSYDTGLNYSGEDNCNASMTNETARLIARCFEDNILTMTEISNLTGVSKRALKHILYGERWQRVVSEYDFSKYDVLDCKYNRSVAKPKCKLSEHESRLLRGSELITKTKYTCDEISKIIGVSVDEVREFCSEDDWNSVELLTGTMVAHKKRSRSGRYEEFKADMLSR